VRVIDGKGESHPEVRYPVVQVAWFDKKLPASGEVAQFPSRMLSIGYLVEQGASVVIAQNLVSANERNSMTMTIPKEWVESLLIILP
jgi:hypothetical protein